ncbi:ABC transporter permease [Puia dinghuensis]|uniref:ABC transporter permease n=1 Tax=Puia dinghuensis TaxID=1792502 RepID=A0A8J2UCJ9_9BACT|nr:ABC transporter permease [Puia dinghuensis]GGA98400.1 ABC transporter permease [Puia dinghuensis]
MFRNYLKSAWRILHRNKTYSAISILGLALGLAAFILINAYVHFENSFDRMHKDGENIYRVESRFYKGDQLVNDWATSTNGYALAMKDNFPEVESYTRINFSGSEVVMRNNDIKFREQRICFADSNFFSFFSYPLLQGDPHTVLKNTNTVAISQSAARRYFGAANPMGRFLDISTISRTYHCMVTGVFADFPANSTLHKDYLLSWATSPVWQQTTWYLHQSYTWLHLKPGTDVHAVEAKFPALAERYKDGPALKELKWAITLIPLADIHLNPAKQYEEETKGDRKAVNFLSGIAWFILFIACINYINLSTARAVQRSKEVGVRKVSGARRWQLASQFLFESFLVGVLALVFAIGLVSLVLAASVPYSLSFDTGLCIRLFVVFVACIVGSGLYPALVLAGLKPIAVLKGRYSFSPAGLRFRKGLVIFQFTLSLLLIAGTLAIFRQIRFMLQQPLGVNIDQTLVVKVPVNTPDYAQKAAAWRTSLLNLSGVKGVTGSGSIPGREVGEFLANRRYSDAKQNERTYEMLKVDPDFIGLYGMKVIAGRGFGQGRLADSTGLVLNEAAVQQFGFASPEAAIGERIWLEVNPGRPDKVIGVIRNYHQQSLQQDYTPVILFMDPAYPWVPVHYYSLKVSTADIAGLVGRIKTTWAGLFPESSFDYFFLDEYYDQQYRRERQFGQVVGWFSALAIVIACMGLFGLTAYTVTRRTKEIGVRKTLGASVAGITRLLTWEFVRLIVIAGAVALPLAGWLISQWMQGYAFRTTLVWWQFALPVALLIAITIATTGWLTVRAARINPANALKEE